MIRNKTINQGLDLSGENYATAKYIYDFLQDPSDIESIDSAFMVVKEHLKQLNGLMKKYINQY